MEIKKLVKQNKTKEQNPKLSELMLIDSVIALQLWKWRDIFIITFIINKSQIYLIEILYCTEFYM